jgi:alkanesulfonate monooxygenase SsuD/methylene tetrahydromethanopterin reductase-like flavin-dependent oxidoreductase (luciferase family)
VEVGLFFSFRDPPPWRRPLGQLYRDSLEQIRRAEQLGFDGIWLGEHHFTDDAFIPSPLTIGAAIAAVTSSIQIGTYVLLGPQHHPVRLAEAATALDILSGGRLVLGLGLGYRRTEFDRVGLDFHRRGARMEECLEVLTGCFTTDDLSFQGRFFDLAHITMTPKPLQSPMPRVILGGQSEPMLRRAARFGCSGLALALPEAVVEHHHELVRQYGGDVSAQRYYGMALGFVGTTDERAWTLGEPHAAWDRDQYNRWFTAAGWPPQFPRGLAEDFIIGSPETWIARVTRQLCEPERLRCDHLVVQLTTSGMAHGDVMEALETFAEGVLPALHAL